MCAVAVPAGTVEEATRRAQFGVTVLAPAFDDAVVADVARRIMGAATRAIVAGVGRRAACELAVFGAHLRGQPLDELSGRGARWAGPVATAPNTG